MSANTKNKEKKEKEIPDGEMKMGIRKILQDAQESDTKLTKGIIRSKLEVLLGKFAACLRMSTIRFHAQNS